ncbi:cold-shock protein [Glycomyces luteolus]|uniref:Cold-shock protein n=1 Tax=Glycomyces luteolus TaxID=2670330 RepID=A0A9X3SSU4_9ACTN|nr:cold-shock protein [Glycomyces luteolus]MDA1361589.1 cold-shock protein [Glycomyces luteolus]
MGQAEIMQGTVSNFNEDTSGEVVLDSPPELSGRRVAFDAAAFAVSGLRFLRLGQRVDLDTDPEGRVVAVRIPTMHA